jgi:polyferredoxin
VFFCLLFFFLLVRSEFSGTLRGAQEDLRLSYQIRWFLQFDPLAAVTNAVATHSLYRGLLWSLVILVAAFFLGRFFCGWICPFGTIHHVFGTMRSERKRGRQRIESNRYRGWQALKYYLLIGFLVAALFGSAAIGWLDPLCLLVRSAGLAVFPAINYGVNSGTSALDSSSLHGARTLSEGLQFALSHTILSVRQPHFRQAFLFGLILVVLVALNLRITRLWCRALCPLGALLGVCSRWSLLHLKKDSAACNNCNRCLMDCQGGDDPCPGARWHKAECHLCFNCTASCPQNALHWSFSQSLAGTAESDKLAPIEGPDLRRRRALAGMAAGVALVPVLRSGTVFGPEHDERLLRPPGALAEADFLARCIRCGACMKVCPNNALHPTLAEAGLEGLWTPVLVPRIGYCEPSCTLCSAACPTGAIWEVTSREKGWVTGSKVDNPIRIGTAFYDRGRCLPWATATDCIVCEEWCPTSPKAIYVHLVEAVDASGNTVQVHQPYVQLDRCVGCGACEYACPLRDRPAVHVTSVGESRSKSNQVVLRRS